MEAPQLRAALAQTWDTSRLFIVRWPELNTQAQAITEKAGRGSTWMDIQCRGLFRDVTVSFSPTSSGVFWS